MGEFFDDFFNGFGESGDADERTAESSAVEANEAPTPIDESKNDATPVVSVTQAEDDNFFASADGGDSAKDDTIEATESVEQEASAQADDVPQEPAATENKGGLAFDFGALASSTVTDKSERSDAPEASSAPERRKKPARVGGGSRKAVSKASAILASVLVVISIILTSVMAALGGGGGKSLKEGMTLSVKQFETKIIEFRPEYRGNYAIITENSNNGLGSLVVSEEQNQLVVRPSSYAEGEYAYLLAADNSGAPLESGYIYRLSFYASGSDVKSDIRVVRVVNNEELSNGVSGKDQESFIFGGYFKGMMRLEFSDNVNEVEIKDLLDPSSLADVYNKSYLSNYGHIIELNSETTSGGSMFTVKANGEFRMTLLGNPEGEKAEFGEEINVTDGQHRYISFSPSESGYYAFYTPDDLNLTILDGGRNYLEEHRDGLVSYRLNAYQDYYIDVYGNGSGHYSGKVYKIEPRAFDSSSYADGRYFGGVFTAPRDGGYKLEISSSSVSKYLYELDNGERVYGNNDGNNVVYTLSANKRYALIVDNYNRNTINWKFNSPSSAERLQPYQEPYISSSSNAYYSFTPSVSGTYKFFTAASFDTKLELYRGSSMINSDDDGADNGNALISEYLNAGTEYRLRVFPYSNLSGYCPTYWAYPLTEGATTNVALTDGTYNYYWFAPTESATYTVTASRSSANIRIYNTYAMSGATTSSGSAEYAMSNGTNYIIGVSTTYSSCTVGIEKRNTSRLAPSQSVSLSSGNSYTREFAFTPSSSGLYKLFTSGSSSLYTGLYVYNSSGSTLASDISYAAGNNNALVSYNFTAGREYTVKVKSMTGNSGSTTLYCAAQLLFDTEKSLTDTDGGDNIFWYVPSTANEYTFTVNGSSSANVYIYSNYNMSSYSALGSGSVKYAMSASTNYIVKIKDCYSSATVKASADTTALEPLQFVTLNSANSYTKRFTFTPSASGTYKLFTTGNSIYTKLYVYDRYGSSLASDTSYSADGNYNALVSYNFTAGETYTVKLTNNGYFGEIALYCAEPISYNTAKSLSDTSGGKNIYWYSPSSSATRRIYSSDSSASIYLYSGYGLNISSVASGTGSVSCSMSSSSTYIVMVTSYSAGATVTIGSSSAYTALQPYQEPYITYSSPAYYSFTPTRSGTYKMFTTASFDTKLTLYQGDGVTAITTDDDGAGNGRNALISHNLTAGTTYVLKVFPYSDSGSGSCPVYCAAPISSSSVSIDLTNGSSNYYWFNVSSSAYRTISTNNTSNITVYNAYGMSSVTSSSSGSLRYQFTSGTYIVKVTTTYSGNTVRIS